MLDLYRVGIFNCPRATSRDWRRNFCLWNFINAGDQTHSMSYKHGAHSSNAPGHTRKSSMCVKGFDIQIG